MRRYLSSISIPLLVGTGGCFPDLPPCETDCGIPQDTDGGMDSASGTASPTGGPIDESDSDGSPGGTGSTGGPGSTGDTTGDTDATGDSSDSGGVVLDDCEPWMAALSWDGGTNTVSSAEMSMSFGDAGGHSPTGLSITGGSRSNVIFTDATQIERNMGILKFPNEASWQIENAFNVLEAGPAVARFERDWASGNMTGTSIYTVIADGRVIRDEVIHNTATNGTFLTAFAALRPDRFDVVEWWGDLQGSAMLEPMGPNVAEYIFTSEVGDEVVVCAHGGSGNVVGWASHGPPVDGSSNPGPGIRATTSEIDGPTSHQFALQSDWVRDEGTIPMGYYYGRFMTVVDTSGGASPCACVAAHAESFMRPGTVTPGLGGNVLGGLPGDADNDGYNEGSGAYEMTVAGYTSPYEFTIDDATAPRPTLLVRMHYTASVTGVSVDSDVLAAGVDYLAQQSSTDPNTVWVLINRPTDGQTISIDYVPE
jgi:hypothetical protein